MGAWGVGVFQNDHAMDLLSGETERWVTALREQLDDPSTSWDDVEGLLVYVRLLALAAHEAKPFGLLVDRARPSGSSRDVAMRWRERFLAIESQSPGLSGRTAEANAERAAARRRAVEATFDELVAAAPDDDAPAPLPPRPPRKPRARRS